MEPLLEELQRLQDAACDVQDRLTCAVGLDRERLIARRGRLNRKLAALRRVFW